MKIPPQNTDLQVLRREVAEQDTEIVFAGTDHGISTMATTTRMTEAEYSARIQLYNYSISPRTGEETEAVYFPPMPPSYRITAGEINQSSLHLKHARKRKLRKASIHV
jgi:hypothetical protein